MTEQERYDLRPDPEFVDRLEWQLRSEMRRERAFATQARRRGWLRAAALVVLSVALGFATATAAQQLQGREQARYLLMEAEGRFELARMRLDWISEMVQQRAAEGSADELEGLEWGVHQARWELDALELQVEEIRASGREVRGELTAPRVGGRDFVGERLQLELERAELQLMMAEREIGREADAMNRAAMETMVEELFRERERVAEEQSLRRAFLAGEISGEEILRQQRTERADEALQRARAQVRRALQYEQDVSERLARGEAEPMEVRAAEYEVAAARLELRLARAAERLADDESGDPDA